MTPQKFRKKPIVIEAMQFFHNGGTDHNGMKIVYWINANGGNAEVCDNTIAIHTLEGIMDASIGDWIIKGVKGEFYPCKPDIFAQSYEEVTP